MASNELFQFSVVSALMDGVADNGLPVAELVKHGEFGLGTFKHMVGEMIVLDGGVYQMQSDGSITKIDQSTEGATVTTPFAMITRFKPAVTAQVTISSKDVLSELLSKLQPRHRNHYMAFRIDGAFKRITVRTVGGQRTPREGLAELGKHQTSHILEDVKGSIVGFRSPRFLQGVSVAGDHLHFITDDRTRGGHLLACDSDGEVELAAAPIYTVKLELPRDDEEFDAARLEGDSEGIAAVEG